MSNQSNFDFEINEIGDTGKHDIVTLIGGNSDKNPITLPTIEKNNLETVTQLPVPQQEPPKVDKMADMCDITENLNSTDFTNDITPSLEEIKNVCEKHKLFGNLKNVNDRNLQKPAQSNAGNWGIYILVGSLFATIGGKLI